MLHHYMSDTPDKDPTGVLAHVAPLVPFLHEDSDLTVAEIRVLLFAGLLWTSTNGPADPIALMVHPTEDEDCPAFFNNLTSDLSLRETRPGIHAAFVEAVTKSLQHPNRILFGHLLTMFSRLLPQIADASLIRRLLESLVPIDSPNLLRPVQPAQPMINQKRLSRQIVLLRQDLQERMTELS